MAKAVQPGEMQWRIDLEALAPVRSANGLNMTRTWVKVATVQCHQRHVGGSEHFEEHQVKANDVRLFTIWKRSEKMDETWRVRFPSGGDRTYDIISSIDEVGEVNNQVQFMARRTA
jgi:head-tail adaptor